MAAQPDGEPLGLVELFLEAQACAVRKVFGAFAAQGASVVQFEEVLDEVFSDLGQTLAAPAPTLAKLRAWAEAPTLKADSTSRWGASAAGFEQQKYRVFHQFTNRTGHQLTFAGEHVESGRWWEQPPKTIEPGATVTWASCGKVGISYHNSTGAHRGHIPAQTPGRVWAATAGAWLAVNQIIRRLHRDFLS
jgi:hypothetical protein